MHYKVSVFSQIPQLYEALTKAWFKTARDAIKKNGRFTVALSGGKTPRAFYQYLSQYKNNPLWKNTHFFIVDERFVSRRSKENNGKMIRESLLAKLKVPASHVHFVDTHQKTARASAKKYEQELKRVFGSLPQFDLILLGVGEDGHAASLFPASAALREKKRVVVFALNPADQWRISLSRPAIQNAKNVFFLVTGKEKASVIKKILSGKSRLPAATVYSKKGQTRFFLDRAARGLS